MKTFNRLYREAVSARPFQVGDKVKVIDQSDSRYGLIGIVTDIEEDIGVTFDLTGVPPEAELYFDPTELEHIDDPPAVSELVSRYTKKKV